MAAISQLQTGTPRRIDELCAHCFLPSMIEVDVVSLTNTGVSMFGTWTGCTDCGTPSKAVRYRGSS